MIDNHHLRIFLTGLILCGAVPALYAGSQTEETAEKGANQSVQLQEDSTDSFERQIVVTYFHSNRRCKSCKLIESMSYDVIEKEFTGMLASGVIEWRKVNVSRKENKHFVQKYGLFAQTVILSEVVNDEEVRWKDLDEVWNLLRKPDDFYTYIKTEVQAFLKGE